MRSLIIIVVWLAAACTTKRNEAVCCVSDVDCARLGLDEPRPCEAGQACEAFECVAAECTTAADCTAPEAPACADHLCVAACRTDDDCVGAAGGSRCAEDGACVGCFANADCPGSAPFCDAEERSCRGCEADTECASGVCLEADARCAGPEELVHVRMNGNDVGDCSSAMPCKTLSYALGRVTLARHVIRIGGGALPSPATTILLDRAVTIDGSDTTIEKPANGPLFSVAAPAALVTLEGMVLTGTANDPTIRVSLGTLRIARSSLHTALVDLVGGSLDLRDSMVRTEAETMTALRCTNATATVRRTDFEHTTIVAANCQLNVSRCRFNEVASGSIGAMGGVLRIENNLVLQAFELADTMSITAAAPGSMLRFNTFVGTSSLPSDGTALSCDGTIEVSSNIFAVNNAHPMGPNATRCPATFSVFDAATVAEQAEGEGNLIADAATFFIDRTARDFHLAGASPARGAAAPGLSASEDFDGKPRPVPSGARADAGCFEAP